MSQLGIWGGLGRVTAFTVLLKGYCEVECTFRSVLRGSRNLLKMHVLKCPCSLCNKTSAPGTHSEAQNVHSSKKDFFNVIMQRNRQVLLYNSRLNTIFVVYLLFCRTSLECPITKLCSQWFYVKTRNVSEST